MHHSPKLLDRLIFEHRANEPDSSVFIDRKDPVVLAGTRRLRPPLIDCLVSASHPHWMLLLSVFPDVGYGPS